MTWRELETEIVRLLALQGVNCTVSAGDWYIDGQQFWVGKEKRSFNGKHPTGVDVTKLARDLEQK